MRMIGVLGGMSWVSTAHYYDRLNRLAAEAGGGLSSAPILLHSVDFAEIAALQKADRWDEAGAILADAAAGLQRAGAEVMILATNTMHLVAPQIEAAISVPFIHIADATGAAIKAQGLSRPGLIATGFTMEKPFYIDRLQAFGLQPLIPDTAARADIHRIIFDELCKDVVSDTSRAAFEAAARELAGQGADCLILGCTEVGLLLGQHNVPVPVFDTVELHCRAAIEAALSRTGEANV
ncbi:aspartate/glutamate racemase family protein [Paracoccus caeni]|uniref:Aspartate/glutamate racemase family protein n=1 Tax=Paracoccus caeni TaxID=657651 RepID=A0A934SH81_9RHOB|nr:aspartate/glutamate racemase family protein [Paracoccus caeni]MBK4217404.1 aspartate/glutamate racemase family protein [Paracoccus caeni]